MKDLFKVTVALAIMIFATSMQSKACTAIRLIAKDGGIVHGRTMEWGAFDLNSRIAVVPRGYESQGLTPEGQNGLKYKAKYGFVGLDLLNKFLILDGMNEKGLVIGMNYHPGFASYPEFDTNKAGNTIAPQELVNYVLGQFATIEELKAGLPQVNVVGVIDESIGMQVESHWMASDKHGNTVVIEFTKGELVIYDAPQGVLTNAPNYDWHQVNLNNYINLSATAPASKDLDGLKLGPLGGGSGMLGMPGDNTPVSRFVRANAWVQTARPIDTAKEGVYELFRILDNFNVPLGPGSTEGSDLATTTDFLRSGTLYTTAWNISDLEFNFHTQHNRRVRMVDLKTIDFSKMGKQVVYITMDIEKEQDIKNITPVL